MATPARQSRADDLQSLLGSSQLWWRCCVEATGSRPEWLWQSYAALTNEITGHEGDRETASADPPEPADAGIGYAVGLFADPSGPPSRGKAQPGTLLRAARTMVAIALSLVPGEDPLAEPQLISEAASYWRGANVLPNVSAISAAIPGLGGGTPAAIQRIVQVLDELPDHGLAGCAVAVQALLMAGAQPAQWHRKRIRILLDATEIDARARTTSVPGKLGTLTVSVLPGGPPGLFPDPRTMGFFAGDDTAFTEALKAAWEYATRKGGARCLLWSLTEPNPSKDGPEEPYLLIKGPSLGLAFALAVSQAMRRVHWPSLLHVARRDYAVTGAVRGDGRLEKVGGIPSKAEAVRGLKGFLFIAPAGNKEPAEARNLPGDIDYQWPATVREARRLTRRPSPARATISIASAVVIVLGVVGVVYRHDSRQEQQQLKASLTAQLVATAGQVNGSNPTLGMQLALQANAQDPSDRTRNNLLSQLAADGSLVRTLHGHTRAVVDASISTVDGTPFAVTGGFDADLRVWDLNTGKCTDVVSDAEQGTIDAVAFDPVLTNLVFASGINTASLWTVTPEGQLANPQSLNGSDTSTGITSAAFSADGLELALGYQDGTIRVVNPTTGSVTTSFVPSSRTNKPNEPIASMTFGAKDSIVYAGDDDDSGSSGSGNVYEINTASPAAEVTLLPTGQYGGIGSLSYVNPGFGSPVLLIGTSEGLEAWNPATGRDAAPFPLAGVTASVTFIKSNAQISAVGTTKGVTIIQNSDLSASGQPVPGVGGVALDQSSTYLLSSASDGDLYQWNLNDQPLSTGGSNVSDATAVAFAPDGSLLTVGSDGDLSRYPELLPGDKSQEPSSILMSHMSTAQTLAVQNIHGQEIAVLGGWSKNQSQVVLVNVKRKTIIHVPQLQSFAKQCGGVRAAAFSPDGSRLVLACFLGGQVSAWNTGTWHQTASTNLAREDIETLAVTDDSKTVVAGTAPDPVGGDGSPQAVWFLHLSNLRTESSPSAAHPGGVLTITQGGSSVFTGGWDGTIRAWTLKGRPTGRTASVNGRVYTLAYDRQSNLLIADTSDGLTLYDPATLQPISPPMSVGDPSNGPQVVVGLTVSPDGKYVVGALSDQFGATGLAEWAVTEASWIGQICAKTTGILTAAEWQQYGTPGVQPATVCPPAQPSGPKATSASSSVGPNPGLTPFTGQAIAYHQGTCADFISSSVIKCGLSDGGYAWTIARLGMGVRFTVYATRGSTWKPVLATSRAMKVYEATAVMFSAQANEPALAVWQVNTGDGSGNVLSIVEGGRLVWDQEGTFVTIQPLRVGLRVWSAVYKYTDSVCCPSGHVRELLARSPSGTWAMEDQEAVSEGSIPRMSASY